MTNARPVRPIPLALTALVAFFSALAALGVSSGMAHAHGHAAAQAPAVTEKAVDFRQDMRKLWEDHVTWTRLAIISLEGGTPDTQATVTRLLRNQTDIGNAVKPFYGAAAGTALTGLLKQHILIAADLIAAAKAGDSAKVTETQARWTRNADEIAAALHDLNPKFWALATMKHEMHMHLKLTTDEALAHLQGKWEADVADYDKVHNHILHMADLLSEGVIDQFPGRFDEAHG
jgi:hypothetical protein